MRFKQIVETTTAGSVATVAQPMMTQTRENVNVPGLKPVQQLMKGKSKKKGPYANSINEGKVKQLTIDLKELTDEEFKKKYSKTKAEIKADMKKVNEDDLSEQDLIVIPGQGRLRRTGFVKQDLDQGEHEGHTLKNSLHTIARAASDLDKRLSTQSEFPEWVSEKIGAAKGMMVTVMDYLISSQEMQHDTDAMAEGNRPFRGVGGAFDRGDDERHDLDPTDWYIVKDGKMFSASIYPKQVQQAIAQGFSRTRAEAKSRANSQGVAEGLSKQFEIIYLDQSGERKRKIVSGTSKEAVARQFKKQYKLEIEQVKQLQQGVAEGSNNDYQQGVDDGVEYFLYTDGEGDTIKDVFLQMKRSATDPKSEKYWRGVVDGMKSVQVEEQVEQGVAEGKIDFAKKLQKNVDKSNKAVVKTRQDIGSRIADIGAGGKEYNVKTDAAWDAAKKKVAEGSAPKEKQKTPYRDINSPEYKAAADKQKEKMAKDKEAEPGKKLADKIDNKKK